MNMVLADVVQLVDYKDNEDYLSLKKHAVKGFEELDEYLGKLDRMHEFEGIMIILSNAKYPTNHEIIIVDSTNDDEGCDINIGAFYSDQELLDRCRLEPLNSIAITTSEGLTKELFEFGRVNPEVDRLSDECSISFVLMKLGNGEVLDYTVYTTNSEYYGSKCDVHRFEIEVGKEYRIGWSI